MRTLLIVFGLFSFNAFASNYLSIANCTSHEGDKVNLLLTERALCDLENNSAQPGLVVIESDLMSAIEVEVKVFGQEAIATATNDLGVMVLKIDNENGEMTFELEGEKEVTPLTCSSVRYIMDC